jgi:signal transduction histidine kinase
MQMDGITVIKTKENLYLLFKDVFNQFLDSKLKEKNIEFKHYSAEMLDIDLIVDKNMFSIIIRNIITNAIKFVNNDS